MSGAMGHRRARILGVALATAAIAGVAAPVAGATTVRTDAIKINGGTADFGSGQHSLGSPQGSGTDVWGFTASGGTLNVSAHLTGTLYWDSLAVELGDLPNAVEWGSVAKRAVGASLVVVADPVWQ